MRRWIVVGILFGLGLRGVVALEQDLDGLVRRIPLVAFLAACVLRVALGRFWWSFPVVLVGAATVAVLVLVGINAALDSIGIDGIHPLIGFPVGAGIIAAATWAYVRWWTWMDDYWEGMRAVIVAGIAGVLITFGPLAYAVWREVVEGNDQALRLSGQTSSRLEVLVLTDAPADGAQAAEPMPVDAWTVTIRTAVVAADGSVDWGTGGPLAPLADEDADRVLLIDGAGAPGRWLAIADGITPTSTPTFAVVDPDDPAAHAEWNAALDGDGLTRRRGRALNGDRVTPQLAVEAALRAPTGAQDLALAVRHRPIVRFDTEERFPRPYDVDGLIATGKMEICGADRLAGPSCEPVSTPGDLRHGGRLRFDPEALAGEDVGQTVYVHVSRSGNDERNTVYLDYWWYFPYNPAEAGGGALCGAGLNVSGITCFDHQSDWEGVTVVVDEDLPMGSPIAVHYAQHDHVVRYGWRALEDIWDRGPRAEHGRGFNTSQRPLVFVSRGRHASYPMPCDRGQDTCRTREVPHDRDSDPVNDAPFDGDRGWERNDDRCLPGCVTPLPTRDQGRQRASWHAYAGRWGSANCVLHVLCSESAPPRGPGEQDRYLSPWCADRSIDLVQGEFVYRRDLPCEQREPTARERSSGRLRMVALGDSFSSGQGAGRYQRGTTGGGNTCFRSPGAWPGLLAQSQGWIAEPSLACSGARSPEVVRDGARTGERERARSQIGRIPGEPDVLTLTIGGNDVGFAAVVTSCVFGDCVAEYAKPSGDVLDGRIDRLGATLPDVYRAIQQAQPSARLVVVGYPRLLPDGSREERADNCAAPGRAISAAEVAYLNDKTRRLDAAIRAAAHAADVEFVDVYDAFEGHELRCDGEPFVNPARGETKLRPASFHPTAAGYIQLADVVARELAAR